MSKFNLTSNIRNFAIISHIDHGKTTLTDRLLEKTNFKKGEKLERILDSLLAEKKKGITIKLNVVQLIYNYSKNSCFFLNLIDTPGHIDFMYEVTCSLSVCEGVILLVDVSKGIQAQTLTYLEIARKLNLKIIPVINKIDLFPFKIPLLKKQIKEIIGCSEEEICLIY